MDMDFLREMREEVEAWHLTQYAEVTRSDSVVIDGRDQIRDVMIYFGPAAVKRIAAQPDTFSLEIPLGKAELRPNDIVRVDRRSDPVFIVKNISPVTENALLAKASITYRKDPPRGTTR